MRVTCRGILDNLFETLEHELDDKGYKHLYNIVYHHEQIRQLETKLRRNEAIFIMDSAENSGLVNLKSRVCILAVPALRRLYMTV